MGKRYLGEGIVIYHRHGNDRLEFKLKCERCNYANSRIRYRFFDVKCDNCGWSRYLTYKEIKLIRELKKQKGDDLSK